MLYGKGVFTTIAFRNKESLLWGAHWRRLRNDAGKLSIDLSQHSEESTRDYLDELIEGSGLVNGRARITFLDESPSPIWAGEGMEKTKLAMVIGECRPVSSDFRITLSPFPINSRSPLAGVKSCNYLEKLLTLDEAKSRGFDEAIQLNERCEVTSAAMANVFWLTDGILYTPSLKTGCLPGTTREFVMENLECREVEAALDELLSADQIFLTSAGLGILQVAEFDSRDLAAVDHPILKLWPAN